MQLKIFLTGDNHIGLKFNNYPDDIKGDLVNARTENLNHLINLANDKQCDLFVIAGDLFDRINIAKKEISKVAAILGKFTGTVAVMPGNHDYDDDVVDMWKDFKTLSSDNTLILNQWKPHKLQDLDLTIYPAFCHQKHSDTNCLLWIKEIQDYQESKYHIGIAHGSLQGLSPDINNQYFNMEERELTALPLDLWLLGHTHIPYPKEQRVQNKKVFNAGTPEPDGMDCTHSGNAWIITVDQQKQITAELVETGKYRFYDLSIPIEDEQTLEKIKSQILEGKPKNKLIRIKFTGRVEQTTMDAVKHFHEELAKEVAYLNLELSDLKLKITQREIEKEFSTNSFPNQILTGLLDDEEALQLAYDLIRGCRNEN